MSLIRKLSKLIAILIFFLAGFFIFAIKVQADCGSILGNCQNKNTQGCGYTYKAGYCPGAANIQCCAPDCGQSGGNSCGVTKSGESCTSLGRTWDCNPCYKCTASAPAPPPPPPPSSSCNCTNTASCSNLSGACKPSAQCGGGYATVSGLCPCSTAAECVCCSPDCGTIGGTQCNQNGSCDSGYDSLGRTHDCNLCCKSGGGGGGNGGGGDNTGKTCGQVCGETGLSDGASGCSCVQGSGSCPSPLVSYGQSSDCTTCCSWSSSIPACGGSGGGGGGGGNQPTPRPTNTPTPTATPTPVPSCTVSLSPNSLSLIVGDSNLLTANVAVQNASVNRVDFSSTDSGVASVDPASDSGSPYRTQVTGRSVGSAQVNASVSLSPSGSCSTGTPSVVSVEAGGWFQTQGGTIHTEGNLSCNIPQTATDRNLSIDQDGFPGVISHQSTTDANLGKGYPSNDDPNHWLAKSSYQGKNFGSWDFFKKKYAREMQTEDFTGNLPHQDGIYYSGSNKTLQGNWKLPANRWLVIMVEGNVNISVNITVPNSSFLALVSANDIIFESSVSRAQGMFIADNSIDTNTGPTQFQGEGFFAASQFILARDLEGNNPTTPAELFTFRPDFLINSYKDAENNLWWFDFKWEEIAP